MITRISQIFNCCYAEYSEDERGIRHVFFVCYFCSKLMFVFFFLSLQFTFVVVLGEILFLSAEGEELLVEELIWMLLCFQCSKDFSYFHSHTVI